MEAKNRLSEKMVEFCRLYASGKMPSEAYSIAFKNDKIATCGVNSNKLLKRADIQEQIAKEQALNKSVMDLANVIAAEKIAEGSIAEKIERMQHLTKIMRGEVKIRADRFFFDSKEGVVVSHEVEELPDHGAQIKAIAELNKMDGSYAPAETKTTITDTRPPAKVKLPDGTEIEI